MSALCLICLIAIYTRLLCTSATWDLNYKSWHNLGNFFWVLDTKQFFRHQHQNSSKKFCSTWRIEPGAAGYVSTKAQLCATPLPSWCLIWNYFFLGLGQTEWWRLPGKPWSQIVLDRCQRCDRRKTWRRRWNQLNCWSGEGFFCASLERLLSIKRQLSHGAG